MKDVKAAVPWMKTLRPHPLSIPCSWFMDDISDWTAIDQHRATSVVHGRCEVASNDIGNPHGMLLSPSGNVLALATKGGYKGRIPYTSYHLPDNVTDDESLRSYPFKVDLMSGIQEICIDDDRRLTFASDFGCVKSYMYKDPNIPKDQPGGRTLRVHTLASKNYSGPLTMFPNGRLAKAGKGQVAIWDLDSLQTLGENGKDIIGGPYSKSDLNTWRDDPENIEMSKGNHATTVIDLPPVTGKN